MFSKKLATTPIPADGLIFPEGKVYLTAKED
jgi:hypothetical protein